MRGRGKEARATMETAQMMYRSCASLSEASRRPPSILFHPVLGTTSHIQRITFYIPLVFLCTISRALLLFGIIPGWSGGGGAIARAPSISVPPKVYFGAVCVFF